MKHNSTQNKVQKFAKSMACSALVAGMLASSASAIFSGKAEINPDVGVSVGINAHNGSAYNDAFVMGGYARLWLSGAFTISPLLKYNYVFGKGDIDGFGNLQAGGLLGYRLWKFIPYIGGSYSHFDKIGYEDTAAINYGINFSVPIPLLPLSIGLDASSQNPKIKATGARTGWQHQFAVTVGIYF